jgi:hypothetical protein
MWEEPEDW